MDPRTFVMLYKAMVHHLSTQTEFGPLKGDIEATEKIQKRANKLVIGLRKSSYTDCLIYLNLYIVKYRRIREDMIEVYKILHGMYDSNVAPELLRNTSVTRGNKYKLLKITVFTTSS